MFLWLISRHEFVSLTFEGDELYTVVGKRTDQSESKGWTAVIMERASRFIVDQRCGKKDAALFKSIMKTVCRYVDHTDDLSFLSDGERRYGNMLFDLCSEVLQTGKRGRPPRTLPKGVRVRVKNKGDQKHKRGRKRPKYQVPQREHPDTNQDLVDPGKRLLCLSPGVRMIEAQCRLLKVPGEIRCTGCSHRRFYKMNRGSNYPSSASGLHGPQLHTHRHGAPCPSL